MNILNKLEKIIEEVISNDWEGGKVTLTNETKILEEYGIDSIYAIQILSMIEEEFGIIIDDEDLQLSMLKDTSTIVDYIEKKKNNQWLQIWKTY